MEDAVKCIGIVVFSALMISIPILCICSFFLNWYSFFKFILSILTFIEWMFIMFGLADLCR